MNLILETLKNKGFEIKNNHFSNMISAEKDNFYIEILCYDSDFIFYAEKGYAVRQLVVHDVNVVLDEINNIEKE